MSIFIDQDNSDTGNLYDTLSWMPRYVLEAYMEDTAESDSGEISVMVEEDLADNFAKELDTEGEQSVLPFLGKRNDNSSDQEKLTYINLYGAGQDSTTCTDNFFHVSSQKDSLVQWRMDPSYFAGWTRGRVLEELRNRTALGHQPMHSTTLMNLCTPITAVNSNREMTPLGDTLLAESLAQVIDNDYTEGYVHGEGHIMEIYGSPTLKLYAAVQKDTGITCVVHDGKKMSREDFLRSPNMDLELEGLVSALKCARIDVPQVVPEQIGYVQTPVCKYDKETHLVSFLGSLDVGEVTIKEGLSAIGSNIFVPGNKILELPAAKDADAGVVPFILRIGDGLHIEDMLDANVLIMMAEAVIFQAVTGISTRFYFFHPHHVERFLRTRWSGLVGLVSKYGFDATRFVEIPASWRPAEYASILPLSLLVTDEGIDFQSSVSKLIYVPPNYLILGSCAFYAHSNYTVVAWLKQVMQTQGLVYQEGSILYRIFKKRIEISEVTCGSDEWRTEGLCCGLEARTHIACTELGMVGYMNLTELLLPMATEYSAPFLDVLCYSLDIALSFEHVSASESFFNYHNVREKVKVPWYITEPVPFKRMQFRKVRTSSVDVTRIGFIDSLLLGYENELNDSPYVTLEWYLRMIVHHHYRDYGLSVYRRPLSLNKGWRRPAMPKWLWTMHTLNEEVSAEDSDS